MARKISLGSAPKGQNVEKLFWTLPANTSVVAKILVDSDHVIEGYFCQKGDIIWANTGNDALNKSLEVEPRFSILLPCSVKTAKGKEYKVIRGPQSVSKQIDALSINQDIQGLIVTIKREDGRFAKYTVTTEGRRAAVTENQEELVADILANIRTPANDDEVLSWFKPVSNVQFKEEDL